MKPELRFEIVCRDHGGCEFTQHITATDVENVNGKLILRIGKRKVAIFPPDLWVSYRPL